MTTLITAPTITTEMMIEAGGNEWSKGNMNRIYFNDSSITKILELSDDDSLSIKQLKPAKKTTYFCLNTELFYSANGMIIRNAIRRVLKLEASKI